MSNPAVAARSAGRHVAAAAPLHPNLERYLSGPFREIEGFVTREAVWMLDLLVQFHDAHGIEGGFFEIGVHQGRFLLALEHAARPGDPGVALDVFEDQALNIDKSGHGQHAVLQANIARHAMAPGRITIMKGDSTAPATRRDLLALGQEFRLISVDGGHTAGHAASDLRLAEDLAAPAAGVILDDFFNGGFPGVTEGLAQYLNAGGTLRPVGVIAGKMLLAPLSWADRMRSVLRNRLAQEARWRVREVTFFGFPYIFARPAN
jgi:hypothetical protein